METNVYLLETILHKVIEEIFSTILVIRIFGIFLLKQLVICVIFLPFLLFPLLCYSGLFLLLQGY
jgi:hypothetical protein